MVTALVFGIFFLVFFLKDSSKDRPARFHTCGNCKCHGSANPTDLISHRVGTGKEKPCGSDSPGGL
ncbi:MAG: hypothetical protein AMJ54_01335 [Deltaproteobacteria bacterium SG8_13]|nr:MAG: hypothetical protein AMJ54_01335 [Deltaproteobacteria bacterium SG8_13]